MLREYGFSEGDTELFRELIPQYCMKPLETGDLSGVVFINTDSETEPVVGILLYRMTRGYIEIEWVVTTKAYSLPDYGADMVFLFVNRIRIRGGASGVFCKFREDDLMAQYFPESQFTWSRVNSGVYRFHLSDVRELKGNIEKRARLENCIPLKDADHGLQNSLLKTAEKNETLLPLPHPVDWKAYDGEISAFYREHDVAEGAILVDKVDDELVIRLLYSDNPVVALTLLEYAFHTAVKKYGEDQAVACPVLSEISEDLVKKIVSTPDCQELIRAEVSFSPGNGTLEDFIRYTVTEE